MEAARYQNLFTYIDKVKPKSIMEIGVWNGNHAYHMIKRAQKLNEDITYYGFDLFESITPEIIKKENSKKQIYHFNDILKKLWGTGARINLFKGFTRETLPKYYQDFGNNIDFIFLDGGHSLETIANDWFWISQFMHQNSVCLLDDYYENTDKIGCKFLVDCPPPGFSFEVLEPQDTFPDNKINFVLAKKLAA